MKASGAVSLSRLCPRGAFACASIRGASPSGPSWPSPTIAWKTASPESQSLDSAVLVEALDYVRSKGRTLLACSFSFGFRKSELLNLRVRQVDLLSRAIMLERHQTKSGTARQAFLTEETFQLLAACFSGKKSDGFVLTRENGEKICDRRDEWSATCVASGLGQWTTTTGPNGKEYKSYRGLTFHDLRRSAVRRMVRSGTTESVAMKISGHSTRLIFDNYDISSEADKRMAARKTERGSSGAYLPADTKTDTPVSLPYEQAAQLSGMSFERNGGDDETRTRDLCRDRAAF